MKSNDTASLKKRYENLSEELSDLKITKAKAETSLENYEKQRDDALADIKKITGTDNLEDAIAKLEKVKGKLESYLEEAEAILNEDD